MSRHPLSTQISPSEDGEYYVLGFPNDRWRRLTWRQDAFRIGMIEQPWWKWMTVSEYESLKAEWA